ncbi:SDR family NAD(P)-dependent oxidoreductase [Bacillus sp. USDA818B3_A]|uniref:SDR family NAD(P)-dependent oxidoreductase n=1 Tax=Bacillus sp. USDA818B3_A TaxID=2698834 RepID=UPI00136CEFA4|nr:SDR family oxidoreductase [Bacillus sp. USDA818B3_A]
MVKKEEVNSQFNLEGKVALVTGATGALGSAAAWGYGYAGAKVMLTARTETKLKALYEQMQAEGIQCAYRIGDPAKEAQVEAVVAATVEEFGGIDILMCSAGMNNPKPILEQPTEEWEAIMDANVKGTWLYCKKAGQVMKEQGRGGKVILVSSTRGKLGMKGYTAYSPSKAAIDLMAKSLACEWGEFGINVNAIGPTVFRSDLTEWMFEDDTARTKFLTRIPIGRLGEPEDYVGVCTFLASSASDFITGTTIYVDGGYLAG